MDISIALPVAVSFSGGAIYLLAQKPKPVEVGRLMFACGLLAALLRFAGHAALHLG